MSPMKFIGLILVSIAAIIGLSVLATQKSFDPIISQPDDTKAAQSCLDHGFAYFQRLSGTTVFCRNDSGEEGEVNATRYLDGR